MPLEATIISTGEELLLGRVPDTNSAFIARHLAGPGFQVRRVVAVGDDPASLRLEIERSLRDSKLVLVTGGLGPTQDDRSRAAMASALGLELALDDDSRRHVEERLRAYGRQATEAQLRQARFPRGATIFPNPHGTARGFACESNGRWLVAMPGVPREMEVMLVEQALPFLVERLAPERRITVETVQLFPISESEVDERLLDLTAPERNPLLGITVNDGLITVSLRAIAEGERAAADLIERDVSTLKDRFAELVIGRGDMSLARAVAERLEQTNRTIAVAESLTGGLIGHMLVDVPGISRFFLADVVAYSNEAKIALLGLPRRMIQRRGAVSPQVAEAMARAACRITGADLGISTTGIAGPTGGTPEKPVGLVYVGLCLEGRAEVKKLNLHGDRRCIKDRAAKHALNEARLALEKSRKQATGGRNG
ncbi:MAG: competence/damage-inducible protein A [Planctomycetes bacterium]|nr:competence/damage-inducible protein A [Planctomycetota bacterium]